MLVLLTLPNGATSNTTNGVKFNATQVDKIVKEKTTAEELVQMSGEPFIKTVVSANQDKGIYMYMTNEVEARVFLTMNVQSEMNQKALDVLLKNGVVVNHTFNVGQRPSNISTQ